MKGKGLIIRVVCGAKSLKNTVSVVWESKVNITQKDLGKLEQMLKFHSMHGRMDKIIWIPCLPLKDDQLFSQHCIIYYPMKTFPQLSKPRLHNQFLHLCTQDFIENMILLLYSSTLLVTPMKAKQIQTLSLRC